MKRVIYFCLAICLLAFFDFISSSRTFCSNKEFNCVDVKGLWRAVDGAAETNGLVLVRWSAAKSLRTRIRFEFLSHRLDVSFKNVREIEVAEKLAYELTGHAMPSKSYRHEVYIPSELLVVYFDRLDDADLILHVRRSNNALKK